MKARRLEPYLDVEQYDAKVKSIDDVDVYYDIADNETYLVLSITAPNINTNTWIRASSLFKNNNTRAPIQSINKHNIMLLTQWYRNNKKKAESMHPILKEVYVQYFFEKHETEYNHAYIVGNDPKHYRKWSVVHVNDGFSEDARDTNIIWNLNQVPNPERIYALNAYTNSECYNVLGLHR